MKFEVGVYPNLDIEKYHASPGISSSGIKVFLESPAQYYYEYHQRQKDEKENQSFAIGRLVHLYALEPEKFDEQFYIYSDGDLPRGKDAKEKLALAARSRTIIKPKDIEECKLMAESLLCHPLMKDIKNKNIEHSLFWEAGVFNSPLRARPDFYDDDVVVDIKTCASFADFERNFKRNGYHRQAPMQIDGLKQFTGRSRAFRFLVVQKKPPYFVAEYDLHPEDLHNGRCEYIDIANDFAECLLYNEWPTRCEKTRILQSYNARSLNNE